MRIVGPIQFCMIFLRDILTVCVPFLFFFFPRGCLIFFKKREEKGKSDFFKRLHDFSHICFRKKNEKNPRGGNFFYFSWGGGGPIRGLELIM